MHAAKAVAPASVPAVVISLDFELRWGRHDRFGLDADAGRAVMEDERRAVPLLLEALSERSLAATWATVGAIGCRDWDDYFSRAPRPPRFENPALAIDPRYAELDPAGALHFAPDLVQQIAAAPRQELGSHTFSHLPLRERGIVAEDVAADLGAAARLWRERFGVTLRSLVFPRNQSAFLSVVRGCGIRVWRGNNATWYHESNDSSTNGRRARLMRLLDDTSPWSRRAAPLEGDMTRGSLFLRLDLPEPAWRCHVAHVRHELAAIRAGEIFHLWWHPHNLGGALARRLGRVKQALDLVAEAAHAHGLRSSSMGELVP
ncbi:MAG: hypothetical protein ACREQ9_18025 [Candidatus Binatia bacterium]